MMKNSKKKGILIAVAVAVIVVIAVAAVCLNRKTDNAGAVSEGRTESADKTKKSDKADKEESENKRNSDAQVITFAVPDICKIDKNNLKKFNDARAADGHDYELEIKTLSYDNYGQAVEGALENGKTDIAFLGFGDAAGNNPVYDLVRSDLVLNLDDILSGDKGKTLYEAFPKNLWEMVKCDKHIYSIPSALASGEGVYAAFNRDYVSDDAISAWDGSIDGIYQILQGVKWDKSDTPRFEYLINGYRFDDMLGCEIRNGLCFDYDTMSVGNPLESQKFTGYLRVLDRMKKDGYMSDDLTNEITYLNNPGLNDAQILKNIKAGNFAAALCVGSVDENFKKDNITVKEVKTYLSSRINSSIGVAKKAKDASAAMDFLSLLYGDEKYGNILLYGEKDKDYKLKDGIAEACDGGSLDDDYLTKFSLNLFVNVYPTKNEKYVDNRKKEFFDFYDNATLSPFIGFEPDTKNMGSISTDLDDFMTGLHGATVDDTLDGAVQKLTADGMDSYLESVRSQWEEYKQ